MKTADLIKRIEGLEREVAELKARPVYVPVYVPAQPPMPNTWPVYQNWPVWQPPFQITC